MAFKVTGASEVIKKLRAVPPNVARRSLLKAVHAAAEPIRDRMEALAPRGDPSEPTLSDIVVQTKRSSEPLTAAVWIGPPRAAYYAYFQEYGTKHHEAQPFARPAFDTEHEAAQAKLGEEVWDALVKALA